MAEEEKDEQVIVIEDLEEEVEGETQEEPQKETEAESKSEAEAEEDKEEKLPPPSSKKRLIFIILTVSIVVILILLLFFVFHSGKKQPKKPVSHKEKVVKKEKVVEHKVVKKKAVEQKTGNIPYNPAVDVHFISAMRLQEKGNYKAAINELKQASIDLYLSYYGIGYIYLKMGDVEKAKEYLIDKTKQYLKLTIENNPDYIAGYVNLFRVYMSDGEYDNAKKIIDILALKKVNNKELSLMKVYYDFIVNNKVDEALNMADKYPNFPLLNGLVGGVFLKQGLIDKACYYFNKALKASFMGSVYYNKMLAEVAAGKYREAADLIPKTYYMDFSKIKCKNYLSFFLLLHSHKFKAAYSFLQLNKKYYPQCYSHFKIIPVVSSDLTTKSLFIRRNINYMFTAELLNMYMKPIKFILKGAAGNIKLGNLYESLGLPNRAKLSYKNTAAFAQALLLSERAVKFYADRNIKGALVYYKKALKKVNTSPILLYNVAIMYMKLHNLKDSYKIFMQLNSAYPDFPLPYLGLFIIKELRGDHKDALNNLSDFLIKFKSLGVLSNNMNDLGFLVNFIQNGQIGTYNSLDLMVKRLFLVVKAAVDSDFSLLNLEGGFINNLGIDMNNFSETSILEYLYKKYPTDYIKRTISDYYLMKGNYEKAYRSLFGIVQYTATDYYKLGIAYLMDGYPDVADNFFTKSILLGDNVYNAYMAKVILQAQSGDFKGVVYYLKLILKKERVWLNTNVFLSFDIKLVS